MLFKHFLFTSLLLILLKISFQQESKVYFIPTLHQLHKSNINYSYTHLKEIIAELKPDIIAVEIRQFDINQDSMYLKSNYPYEMWNMKYWFPKTKVVGFDWLGDDIEGKALSPTYWKEVSPIKKWERELNDDSLFNDKILSCRTITKQRIELLSTLSLKDLLKSKNSALVNQFYNCLNSQLEHTRHERILIFYEQRNQKMLSNIEAIIANNKGKTIVIITGDDHYIALKDKFKHLEIN
jgi:hypothetical protein